MHDVALDIGKSAHDILKDKTNGSPGGPPLVFLAYAERC
jgi:hypothetical protein